ncbi:MAG: Na+/H+ antiporter [Planctomycetes bacterium]|nr:Na+/H+ antiporter [Planctomycetota bacterium]
MQAALPLVLVVLAVLALVHLAAPRLRTPAPILLAIAGAGVGCIPGLPTLRLDPELILVMFLPPLLYADAFGTSWIDFRRWLRPILMLAFALVAVTTFVVGITVHALLPTLPWPVCFILGAIVSPTDTVAVQAVLERLHVSRRITAILGGESLVNDATGLVGMQVGVAVMLSGAFEAGSVALQFAWVVTGGVAVGLGAGWLFSLANRWVREPRVLFVLSLISPYLAFLAAHGLGTSGVLAVVISGFVVAWRIHTVPAQARIELYSTWKMLVFVLNGICFVIIGLETPRLLRETNVADSSVLVAALAVSGAVIGTRLLWAFPNAYLPLYLSRSLREKEGGYPAVRGVALVSWCGVRGVVSLAAALSLPYTLADGSPFPGRDAVIACTLVVILVTLIAQGLTLQPLIHLLGLRADLDSEHKVRTAREAVLAAGIARLDEFCNEVSCPISVHHWRELMADELALLRDEDNEARKHASTRLSVSNSVRRAVSEAQDRELLALRERATINDRTYVELQLELDKRRGDDPE